MATLDAISGIGMLSILLYSLKWRSVTVLHISQIFSSWKNLVISHIQARNGKGFLRVTFRRIGRAIEGTTAPPFGDEPYLLSSTQYQPCIPTHMQLHAIRLIGIAMHKFKHYCVCSNELTVPVLRLLIAHVGYHMPETIPEQSYTRYWGLEQQQFFELPFTTTFERYQCRDIVLKM